MQEKPSFLRFLWGTSIIFAQLYALYLVLFGEFFESGLIFAITFGTPGAPSDVLTYLDALFSTSLPKYRKKLTDNIGATNAILYAIIKSKRYESYNGGTDIREPLMYALAVMDWYDGYEELPDTPTDGITQAIFEARQAASPISYSMKEVIQNREMLINLVEAKIMQSEKGIHEGFAQALLWGAGNGALRTPRVGAQGSLAVEPLFSLIDYTPTTSRLVGNINQSLHPWWRNVSKTSTATTYDGLIQEFLNVYNTASLGTGGSPDIILVDQITFELMSFALFQRYRNVNSDVNFPFNNIQLPFGSRRTLMVMDDKMPDVESDTISTATYGTAVFINSEFLKLRYIQDRNFEMLRDENGKSFFKPIKGDSRLGHIAWMGQLTVNNRRKQAVLGKIARTLT